MILTMVHYTCPADEENPEIIENLSMLVKTRFNVSNEIFSAFAQISNLKLYSPNAICLQCHTATPGACI